MAQRKPKPAEDGKTQRQRFIEAARELGADGDEETFRRAVRKVASAPPRKPKKAARKPNLDELIPRAIMGIPPMRENQSNEGVLQDRDTVLQMRGNRL